MQRRHALQHLLRGLAAGSLLGPAALHAQTPRAPTGVVQTGPQAAATPVASAQPARPTANFEAAPEVKATLRKWELYTRNIQRLGGEFDRYVYDSTFLMERRAVGEFWFETPDKGRIDLKPCPDARLPPPNENKQRINPRKLGPNGQPFYVQADAASRWVCTGSLLLYIDDEQKTYEVMEIPPHLQGQNISKSPLPFLFGVNAQNMEARYFLAPGSVTELYGRPVVHVVASPKLQADSKEWQRAEVMLDPGTYFKDAEGQPIWAPVAIKLLDPSGQSETVYFFRLDKAKLNERRLFDNPFKEPDGIFTNYKCTGRHKLAADDSQQRTVETPSNSGQTR